MGCLLCCFRVPDVDQEHESSDDGQQSQQPNAMINRSTQAGILSVVLDFAIENDALLENGANGTNLSQVNVLEPDLESNKLIPRRSEDDVASRDDECPICLEEYTNDNPKIATKCSHYYHLGCILDWHERSEFCPVCSRVMVFDEMN